MTQLHFLFGAVSISEADDVPGVLPGEPFNTAIESKTEAAPAWIKIYHWQGQECVWGEGVGGNSDSKLVKSALY